MAKSQETFRKKEKEKKKQKKKKDKAEKMEERRANSTKSSFEDMLAYVDENGNIVSTPPDPTKKKVIEQEDILVSTAKQLPEEPEEIERTGKVSFFNDSKGYGFIIDAKSGESIFVHTNGLLESINENDSVMFEIEKTPKGPSAVKVKKK